jgi:hypothetical protein
VANNGDQGDADVVIAKSQTSRVMFRTSDPSEHSRERGRGICEGLHPSHGCGALSGLGSRETQPKCGGLEPTEENERGKDPRSGGIIGQLGAE